MLAQKSLTQFDAKDTDVTRSMANVAAALNPVLTAEVLDGVLVRAQRIPASGKLVVPHGLGRPPLGYLVCAADAAVALPYAVAAEQYAPTNVLVLHFSSGAGATISLWVF